MLRQRQEGKTGPSILKMELRKESETFSKEAAFSDDNHKQMQISVNHCSLYYSTDLFFLKLGYKEVLESELV